MLRLFIGGAAALCAVSVAAHAGAFGDQPAAPAAAMGELPEGEGRELTTLYCTQCHAIGMVTSQRHTRAEWEDVIVRMADQGFYASPEETETIVGYLTEHFNRS